MALQANLGFFTQRNQKKIELVAGPGSSNLGILEEFKKKVGPVSSIFYTLIENWPWVDAKFVFVFCQFDNNFSPLVKKAEKPKTYTQVLKSLP